MVRHLPFLFLATKGLAGDDMCILESERLILRPPRPSDIQSMTVWLSDYDVARMTSRVPHPYTLADAEGFIASFNKAPGQASFLITARDGGYLLGGCGVGGCTAV